MQKRIPLAVTLSIVAVLATVAHAQNRDLLSVRPHDRITGPIEDGVTVRLQGNRHPLARPEFDNGLADAALPMDRMILTLRRDHAQQTALDAFVEAQHTPGSAYYQHWLSPEEFADRFGVSRNDSILVATWLRMKGFKVEEITGGRQSIVFSGTAEQIRNTFFTEVRRYLIDGSLHYANASDPEIPAALAPVVGGIATMHNFARKPLHHSDARPQYTSGTAHYLAPADFATIYDAAPLYKKGVDGTGQTIAIVGRTNILLSDVHTFRSQSGLVANDPTIVLNGPDPGIVSRGEETEAVLDVEWSGAVAPKASVQFVVSKSTSASDGVDLSAQYIVTHNLAPVLSVSFGSCEAQMGSAELGFYNNLWQQAAAEGISVFVASGDSGAAGCDLSSSAKGSYGLGINGLCSSPYSTCVGGTQLSESANAGLYWSGSSDPGSRGSALTYIPEQAWNESAANGGSGLWSTGGGASIVYTKPSWQTAPGVPADGFRDVPDVALSAAGHDAYLIFQEGQLGAVAGTSAASPSFAGLMALVNQSAGSRQGNANPRLYSLFSAQAGTGTSAFHAVTGGNNSVPNVPGFTASANYNQATGLGSVDASSLIANWTATGSPTPTGPAVLTLTGPTDNRIAVGGTGSITFTVTAPKSFNAAVSLAATGMPSGVTVGLSPATMPAPGTGVSSMTLAVGAAVKPGTYPLQIVASGGAQTAKTLFNLIVTAAAQSPLTLTLTPAMLQLQTGANGTANLLVQSTGISGMIQLSVSGVPSGISAGFTSVTQSSTGTNVGMRFAATTGAMAGSYPITITATAGSTVATATETLTIAALPSCTLSATVQSLSLANGGSSNLQVSCTNPTGGLTGPVTLSISGAPSGITAAFSSASLVPGTARSTLTVSASGAKTGSTQIMVKAVSGTFSAAIPITLSVLEAPSFNISASTGIGVVQGTPGSMQIFTTANASFNSAVAFSASGLPAGVTVKFAPASIAAPGSGSTQFTVSADPNLSKTGNYTFTLTASGGNVTKTGQIALQVMAPPHLSLTSSAQTLSMAPGSQVSTKISVNSTSSSLTGQLTVSVAGLPAGVTATLSPATLPGSGTTTLQLQAASTVKAGSYPISVGASGGYATSTTIPINLVITGH